MIMDVVDVDELWVLEYFITIGMAWCTTILDILSWGIHVDFSVPKLLMSWSEAKLSIRCLWYNIYTGVWQL